MSVSCQVVLTMKVVVLGPESEYVSRRLRNEVEKQAYLNYRIAGIYHKR